MARDQFVEWSSGVGWLEISVFVERSSVVGWLVISVFVEPQFLTVLGPKNKVPIKLHKMCR